MAPELRLSVGLDLAFFRQQMRKAVNIAQSEFTAQLQVKFNRQALNNEIRNLDRAIKHKKFNVELNLVGSLTGKQFDQIQARLDALAKRDAVEIPVSIRAAATGKDVQLTVAQLRRKFNENQQVVQGGGKLRFPVSIKSGITNADVTQFRRDVESKLKGIKVKVKAEVGEVSRGAAFAAGPTGAAGLYEFMRTQGLSGGNMPGQTPTGAGRRAQFQNAVEQATSKELERMLRTAEVAGRSKLKTKAAMQKKLLELDDIAMENILGNLKMQMQEPRKIKRSFLDQVARAVMYMAGVDPEVLRQQAAARRLPPAIDFPATVPSRTIPIGPSATGRALTGVSQAALPGQSIAAAKYLPSDLGVELKNILRNAAYTFVDSLNQRVRQVSVREIGQAQLAPSRVAGLLPSAVGRQAARYGGPGEARGRRIAEAYARSAARGASVMAEGPQGFALGAGGSGPAGPFRQYAQPPRGGAIVPFQPSMAGGPSSQLPPGYFTGGKIQQALKGADQYLKQSRVPLTGAIQELGGEFGNAVKQVLLFGTAYKALAFIIDLPNQALEAARSLQSFNNQVNAITGNAANAQRAIDFINASVEQFNIPLQSARDGFLKLYASMEPAGIPADVIEGLFTGISQASATLGLSADQVDRVTYAFSQMASKGKIMSEEVTGQLGDVIPGALSLMADAAGLSMAEFKDAMEKGQLSGKAMQQVFENLEIVLSDRFGEGAVGAADTLQGSMNDLQTSVTRMYEAFEPLVELFATSAFPALSGMVRDATEAITAFAAGVEGASDPTANLSSRGLAMYNVLGQVATIAQSLKGVIESLAPTFITLGQVILLTVEQISRLLNTGAGQWFAKFAIQVALVTTALQLLARAGIGAAIRGLIMLVTNTKGAIAAFKVLITTARVAKIALGGLVGGLILVGLEMLAGKLLKVGDAARDAAADARQLRAELDAAVQTGNIEIPRMAYQAAENRAQSIKQSIDVLQKVKGGGRISAEEYARLQRTGLAGGITRGEQGVTSALRGQIDQSLKAAQTGYVAALNAAGTAKEQWESAIVVRQGMEAQRGAITPVDLSGSEGTGAGKSGKGSKTAKEIRDISANRLELSKRLFAAQEAENQVAIVNLQTALSILDAEENIEGANDRQRAILEALSKRRLDLKKIAEDEDEEQKRADEERLRRLEEINRAREEYNSLLIDAQEATGAISPDEAEQRRRDAAQLQTIERLKGILTPTEIENLKLAFEAIPKVGSIEEAMVGLKQQFADLMNPAKQLVAVSQEIGDSFTDSFSSVITGAMSAQEALAQFFGNIGKMFADMAAKMISQWLVMKSIGLIGSLFGGGSPASSGGGGGGGVPFLTNLGADAGAFRPIGIPLTPYANGGIVTGPTMGLVGEGRYNEAIVPLPDGKSIPVELGGDAKNIVSNITVNVSNGQARSEGNGGANDLGRKLEGAVKQVIIEELRPGGVLAGKR